MHITRIVYVHFKDSVFSSNPVLRYNAKYALKQGILAHTVEYLIFKNTRSPGRAFKAKQNVLKNPYL